jgi:hypothetical protein
VLSQIGCSLCGGFSSGAYAPDQRTPQSTTSRSGWLTLNSIVVGYAATCLPVLEWPTWDEFRLNRLSGRGLPRKDRADGGGQAD